MHRTLLSGLCAPGLALCLGGAAAFGQPLDPGYRIGIAAGEVTVTLNGESVFEVRQDPLDPVFSLRGLRDVTGNGHADLAVIWRSGRSTARFVLLELQPGGVAILHEETGMTEAILGTYGALTDDQLGALATLAPRHEGLSLDALATAREMQVATAPGRWVFRPGNWNEGSAAELGWARKSPDDDSLSEIRFRCPDTGDDIWVLVDRRHGTMDEVQGQVEIIADGRTMPLALAPQLDDETGNWYPIGMLPRSSDLFTRLSEAGTVEMAYGAEVVTLIVDGPDPEDKAALAMFSMRCGLAAP
ncbi:hypothetical protein [Polymorphum gilvum]|uniref:Uncharacterized protein n=1 Tax=Polymorphum gilvum (strain LMG 25793 / CGMCC 1.9160 / SL003B-26A1) TaxID=991905 RepID=F2IWP7_POLGS|nr:hypothetical protein [Polymorphum gilvum]ADZ70372.1 hypothetical protein SL003B_1946 [Polymorphum gilvum SL003B-26A1]